LIQFAKPVNNSFKTWRTYSI